MKSSKVRFPLSANAYVAVATTEADLSGNTPGALNTNPFQSTQPRDASALVLFVLLLTGIAATCTSAATPPPDCTLGAFAAGVNAVAILHYVRIWMLQDKKHAAQSAEKINAAQEIQKQRYSDWLITLPFMVIDLYKLLAVRGHESWLPVEAASPLAAIGVGLGYYSEGISCESTSFVVAFAFACAAISVSMAGILVPAFKGRNTSSDLLAVCVLTLPWTLYPIVTLVRRCSKTMRVNTDGCDGVYALLDAFCKGGIAFWVAYRSL